MALSDGRACKNYFFSQIPIKVCGAIAVGVFYKVIKWKSTDVNNQQNLLSS